MKKYRLRLLIYAGMFLCIIFITVVSCYGTWMQILENKKEKEELTIKYNELLEDEELLESEVVKLQDPEYVAKYAREKYLFTKEGELIIDMNSTEE